MIAIINYGMGNCQSIKNALDYLGISSIITDRKEDIVRAEKLILPGVGSFRRAMINLEMMEMDVVVKQLVIERNVPILGICLGMQLLSESSDEDGGATGLGLINARVRRFDISSDMPVPHVGFNSVHIEKEKTKLFKSMEDNSDFYFVHSYRIKTGNECFVSGSTYYGEQFVSAYEIDNIFGTQFHPEKSQSNGLQLLKNYSEV